MRPLLNVFFFFFRTVLFVLVFFVGKMTGASFQVTRCDTGKEQEINVEDSIDYEKEFPNSRFKIVCKGIGLKK